METIYIDRPEALAALREGARGEAALGVDCEAAGFHRYSDRVCLVQVATPRRVFVVDALAVDAGPPLREILGPGGAQMVAHGADFDLRLLDRDLGVRPARIFDTEIAAALAGAPARSLSDLVSHYLGVELPKGHQRADWAKRPLPSELLQYAARDTRHLLPLRRALEDRLRALGRLEWAREEFEVLREARWEEDEEVDPVTRVSDARDLSPRELARLRTALRWRDEIARRRDRAPFRVAPDSALVAVAREAPGGTGELARLRGISPALARREGAALLDALRRVADRSPADLPPYPPSPPRPRPGPRERELFHALKAVRNRKAEALGIDRGVLLPNRLLSRIARDRPGSRRELLEVGDVRRWQVEVMGEEVLDALADGGGG